MTQPVAKRPPRRSTAGDGLSDGADLVLSASEIGAYAFCPQSWHLQRAGAPVSGAARARLDAGTQRHRELGRASDALQVAAVARGLLILVALLALGWLVIAVGRGGAG